MHPDLDLERTSRRPADGFRRLIGEEDLGNEAEEQAYDADAEDKRVAKQDVNDADWCSRHLAKRDVCNSK